MPSGASFPDAVPSYGEAVDRRVRQRRVPFRRHGRRRIFIQLANSSAALLRWYSSAISGFRSLCGPQSRRGLLSALALNRTCVLEPLPGAALAGERWLSSVLLRGLRRCRARNVVAPGQYSKWFLGDSRAFIAAIFVLKPPVERPPGQVSGDSRPSAPPPSSDFQYRNSGGALPPPQARRRAS